MKNIVIYIFLFLFNFWGYNQTRFRSRNLPAPNLEKTWEIVEISNNKITSFLDGFDTINKLPKTAIGYPIKYYDIDEIEYWDDNKNRYLFKYGKQYCIADSNLNIIIDLSDSIIPSILYDTLGSIKIDYDDALYTCIFQVIRNNLTQLVNNDGNIITPIPFEGIINFSFWKLEDALNQKVFITRTLYENQPRKYGIIDFKGEMLLPNQYDQILLPEYWTPNPYFLIINYKTSNYRQRDCFVFSHNTKSIIFAAENMDLQLTEHEVYVFEKDGLFGIFHPTVGVIEKPKYVKIYPKKNGYYHMYDDLILVTKKGKEIKWVLSEDIWKLYPTLRRD